MWISTRLYGEFSATFEHAGGARNRKQHLSILFDFGHRSKEKPLDQISRKIYNSDSFEQIKQCWQERVYGGFTLSKCLSSSTQQAKGAISSAMKRLLAACFRFEVTVSIIGGWFRTSLQRLLLCDNLYCPTSPASLKY